MFNRRDFLKAAAGAAAATKLAEAETAEPVPPAPPGAPNVLIFMPDQVNGATVLPGSPVIRPNMDRFLRESVAFSHAYCPAPHCCPSRASFMTGLYPSEHGVFNNVTTETAIHPDPFPGTQFWPQWLRAAGYSMGYSGKLHVGRDVKAPDCGFDDLSTLEQDSLRANQNRKAAQWAEARREAAAQGPRKPGEIVRPEWGSVHLYATEPDASYERSGDYRVMQAGIAGMKRFAAEGKPWCVMISNSGAHDVYNAPKRFVDLYANTKIELPESFADTLDDKPRVYQRQRYQTWSQLSDDETRDALRHYYAKCSMQDAMFGDLLKALEETGQAENTIVIYVSDHGDYCAAHGLWMKGVPAFQEAYHIPAVVRWPKGATHAGRLCDAFVEQVDWSATILEACGVAPRTKLSGASLLPWLRGETPSGWRDAVYSQMNGVELYYTQRITMTKDWKYVYNGFDYDELYDLRNDPHEMRNLAFPDLHAKRERVLSGRGVRTEETPWPHLEGEAEAARKMLLAKMWSFAAEHRDIIFNPYGTVAFAPYGPGLGDNPGTSAPPGAASGS